MLLVFAAASVCLVGSAAGSFFGHHDIGTHLKVVYSSRPDPAGLFSHFPMPRKIAEGLKDNFAKAAERPTDRTSLYCRDQDYRVCVLFDAQGSVAGMQWSVSVSEIDNSHLPYKVTSSDEWFRGTVLGVPVYTTIVFFVPLDVLLSGGRAMNRRTPTAPDGLYILQTDEVGNERARLHVPAEQDGAEAVGFREQACHDGMGKHYFQDMAPTNTCDKLPPYFTMYGPRTKRMLGFGFEMFGRVSDAKRNWYERATPSFAKSIAPKSPVCLEDFVRDYGIFTMHVYFDKHPYFITC